MRQPDIEIYLKNVNLKNMTDWLEKKLGPLSAWHACGKTMNAQTTLGASTIPITWTERAIGNWHCLYIGSDQSPWATDLDCARSVHDDLQIEVRCSPGLWQESDGEEEADRWLRVDDNGVTELVWRTD